MTEAVIANLALTLRVLIVGGFCIVMPRINRKGLLFGAYIGEEAADEDAACQLRSRWISSCLKLMALSLAVGYGISLTGNAVPGNFTGTAVLLLGVIGLYLRFHFRAKGLVTPGTAEQAATATAPLISSEPTGVGLAKFALGLCLAASLAVFVYAMLRYDPLGNTSFAKIMLAPSVNLALSPFLALIAVLTATAKRSFRGGSGGRSFETQDAFRATVTRLSIWAALLFCAFMSVLSVQVVRYGLFGIDSLGIALFCAAGVLAVGFIGYAIVNQIRIMKTFGQGGAFMERGTVDAPLTNGLADNAHWVWGVYFVDRDDPSIMVEKRFGLGYTFNYGNRTAILILVAFLVLCLGLTALILFEPFVGGM